MDISSKVPPVQNTPYVQQGNKVAPSKSQAVAMGDRVELSARAKEMQAAQQAVKQMADVDEDKVAKIKAQIQAGTYKVEAELTAARMIEESLLSDLD